MRLHLITERSALGRKGLCGVALLCGRSVGDVWVDLWLGGGVWRGGARKGMVRSRGAARDLFGIRGRAE